MDDIEPITRPRPVQRPRIDQRGRKRRRPPEQDEGERPERGKSRPRLIDVYVRAVADAL